MQKYFLKVFVRNFHPLYKINQEEHIKSDQIDQSSILCHDRFVDRLEQTRWTQIVILLAQRASVMYNYIRNSLFSKNAMTISPS